METQIEAAVSLNIGVFSSSLKIVQDISSITQGFKNWLAEQEKNHEIKRKTDVSTSLASSSSNGVAGIMQAVIELERIIELIGRVDVLSVTSLKVDLRDVEIVTLYPGVGIDNPWSINNAFGKLSIVGRIMSVLYSCLLRGAGKNICRHYIAELLAHKRKVKLTKHSVNLESSGDMGALVKLLNSIHNAISRACIKECVDAEININQIINNLGWKKIFENNNKGMQYATNEVCNFCDDVLLSIINTSTMPNGCTINHKLIQTAVYTNVLWGIPEYVTVNQTNKVMCGALNHTVNKFVWLPSINYEPNTIPNTQKSAIMATYRVLREAVCVEFAESPEQFDKYIICFNEGTQVAKNCSIKYRTVTDNLTSRTAVRLYVSSNENNNVLTLTQKELLHQACGLFYSNFMPEWLQKLNIANLLRTDAKEPAPINHGFINMDDNEKAYAVFCAGVFIEIAAKMFTNNSFNIESKVEMPWTCKDAVTTIKHIKRLRNIIKDSRSIEVHEILEFVSTIVDGGRIDFATNEKKENTIGWWNGECTTMLRAAINPVDTYDDIWKLMRLNVEFSNIVHTNNGWIYVTSPIKIQGNRISNTQEKEHVEFTIPNAHIALTITPSLDKDTASNALVAWGNGVPFMEINPIVMVNDVMNADFENCAHTVSIVNFNVNEMTTNNMNKQLDAKDIGNKKLIEIEATDIIEQKDFAMPAKVGVVKVHNNPYWSCIACYYFSGRYATALVNRCVQCTHTICKTICGNMTEKPWIIVIGSN